MRAGRRLVLAGAAIGAVVRTPAARAQTTVPVQEITVSLSSTSFVVGGVKIGEKAGIFARRGLALRSIVMDSGSAAMAALIGGSVQFAITGPPEALAARARGPDILIVANLYAGLAGSLVLAKSAAARLGVTPSAAINDRLRALDGLLIAVPSATSALLAPYRAGGQAQGAQMRFTYMAQGTMPAALENGAVQGMVASFPFAGAPILRDTGVLWIDGPGGDLPAELLPASSSSIQTSNAFLQANRPVVARLQQSVQDIAAFIQADPPAAQKALAAAYPQLSPAEVELAFAGQWRNWTKPFLTVADIVQEIRLLKASAKLPGLDTLDPQSVLIGPL